MSPQADLWTHTTRDFELILNLVLMESGAESTVEANQNTSTLSRMPVLPSSHQYDESLKLSPSSSSEKNNAPFVQPTIEKKTLSNSLQGNLADMPITSVLQSIALSKMTGRLSVEQDFESANVYFEMGMPVHAACLQAEGDFALIELVAWDTGRFKFFTSEHTTNRTVKKRLENALIEGSVIADQYKYLISAGIESDTYVRKKNDSLTEAEFESALAAAPVTNMKLHHQVFQKISDTRFIEILTTIPLPKVEWIPVMYNLLSNNLIELSDKPTLASIYSQLQFIELDPVSIEQAYEAILRPDTGVANYPLFLHFLELEFLRFVQTGFGFSLVVFEMSLNKDSVDGILSAKVQKSILQIIRSQIRKIDVIGHFRTFEFALLLPDTNSLGAISLAKQILEIIRLKNIGEESEAELKFFMGIASAPHDTSSLDELITAALYAKQIAKKEQASIVTFESLYS